MNIFILFCNTKLFIVKPTTNDIKLATNEIRYDLIF